MKILEEDITEIARAHGFHAHPVKNGKEVSFFLYRQNGCSCRGVYVIRGKGAYEIQSGDCRIRAGANELECFHALRSCADTSKTEIPLSNLKHFLLALISELRD